MWGPIVRPFGRALNYIAFSVAVLLCAIATILVDARMYLSAGFFGLLGATGLVRRLQSELPEVYAEHEPDSKSSEASFAKAVRRALSSRAGVLEESKHPPSP
jgi:hypothetical protein